MKKLIPALTIFIALLSSCKKEKDNNNEIVNPPPQTIIVSFPLAVGNSWKYFTDIKVDSVGIILLSQNIDSYWNVVSDTAINGMAVSKISQLDSNYNGNTHLGYTYYANKPDGFYAVANENSGSMFYLREKISDENNFNLFCTFANKVDSLFFPDTALYLLKLPGVANDTWASHEFDNIIPMHVKRKWIGSAIVTTTAGTFNCMKLQVFFDQDNNNQPDDASTVFQYFAAKGLIMEEQTDSVHFSNGSTGFRNQITKLVQVNF